MKKRSLRAVAALALSASMMTGNVLAANVSFKDVPSTHWSYSYVKRATEKGLVAGVGDGRYGVDDQLSIGQFATMLCGLIYPNEASKYQVSNASWWYPYLEAAYQKGALAGTVAGDRRAADKKWTASVAEAGMNRYDLAQVIYNVSKSQGWGTPSTTEMFFAMASIPDWSEVPTQYQNAVATAYAKSYLSGVDSKGTFGGKNTMTRGQVAVVLCSMMDAKSKMDAPTYTNRSGKLVDGKDANEDNVKSALKTLQYEFYEYDIWDTSRVYTSAKLGTGSGSQGFAYMLSDRVFGALPVQTQSNANRLKPGDVVYLRSEGQYVVVTSVSSSKFTYAACDSLGIITWRGSYDIDDLGSRDTIYTRYEGEVDNELDEDEVSDRIDEFFDREYEDGDECYEAENGYTSPEFYSKKVYGDRAFAYYMSDYIFGEDTEVERMYGDDVTIKNIRLGDVIYLADDGSYGIVISVNTSKKRIDYAYTTSKDIVKTTGSVLVSDLTEYDTIYTRYGESNSGSSTTGKITESEVETLIERFQSKKYGINDTCSEAADGYRSSVFTSKTVTGDRAFAYYMSDYIFGERKVTSMDGNEVSIKDIRLGDVISLSEENSGRYVVVTEVDTKNKIITYLYTNSKNKVKSSTIDFLDLEFEDTIYTRYPD